MIELTHKIVDFHKYCETCKYKETKETDEPCDECLDHPVNLYTHKPIKYKEVEKKTASKKKNITK